MQVTEAEAAAKATESATLATLFASAHGVRDAAISRSKHPPRIVGEWARTMARHLGMPDRRQQELVPSMAFWQAYLPSALGRDTTIFTQVRSRLPYSYEVVRSVLAEMESHRQYVVVIFHMAAMPLIAALLATACIEINRRPGNIFLSPQNIAWLQAQNGRWVFDMSEPIASDQAGLRRLISGLRLGTVTRLLILLDGPHPPGGPASRELTNIAPTLAFKTGLLSRILAMGIPMRPLTHLWESGALALKWHPYLNHTGTEAISEVASLIEDLLRRHPEQWSNWPGAGLRT